MGRLYDRRREEAKGRDAIGNDYELQIMRDYAHRYSVFQYKVGKAIDLKAENPQEIILIQCKNWRDTIYIDVNDIRLLAEHRDYLKNLHNKRVTAMIVHTAKLSEETEKYADRYNVKTEQVDYHPTRDEIMREMGVGMKQHTQEGLDAIDVVGEGTQHWFNGWFGRKSGRRK